MKPDQISALITVLAAVASIAFFLFRAGRTSRDIEGNLERKIDQLAGSVQTLKEDLGGVNERIMRIETILLDRNHDR